MPERELQWFVVLCGGHVAAIISTLNTLSDNDVPSEDVKIVNAGTGHLVLYRHTKDLFDVE